jgi:autotransporter-associated beta strand protein
MKRKARLIMCAALAVGLTPQITSAVLLTNTVKNVQAMNVRATLDAAGNDSGEVYNATNGSIRNQYVVGTGGTAGKAWIQFDLGSNWAFYGQTNLTSATLTLWNQNGSTRRFQVAGIADSAGLEGWTASALTWSNAPANDYSNLTTMGYSWDFSKCFGGTNIWDNLATGGIDCSVPANAQGAYYISTNATSRVYQFLTNDTDGKVTMSISDGPANSNQTIPIGTNGVYDGQPLAPSGIQTKDSPTLTLVFNVRVALTGGGIACPGGSGVDVYLGGTDLGFDYLLYTNNTYTGQKISGNGSAASFGLKSSAATYTAVASNLTTTITTLLPGTAVVKYSTNPPTITAQPASFAGATNTIAVFTVAATDVTGSLIYQWFRNGSALSDDSRHTGTATTQMTINPVQAGDAATSANGYYCLVANSCGYAVASTTNALTIQLARNLVWLGSNTNLWDIGTSVDWSNSVSATLSAFNQGDNVTLDDNAVSTGIALANSSLYPGTITFNHSSQMGIGGSGSIVGQNTALIVNGTTTSSQLTISNANSFGGGTTINDGWLILRNLFSVGSGTITMAGTGLSLLETVATGGANAGYPGLNLLANCTVQIDGGSAYAGSFVGPITGPAGKILTFQKAGGGTGDNIRIWNTNFTCNADIVLNIGLANFATYNDSGVQIYNGAFSGSGVLFTRQGGRIILNGTNTYTGGTRLSAGTTGVGIDSVGVDYSVASGAFGTGPVTIEGNVSLFASGGAHTNGNPVVYTAGGGTLTFVDTNVLTMAGSFDLGSGGISGPVDRTVSAATGARGIISGIIVDNSGQGCGLSKTGNGTLCLDAANTYLGQTTVSGGVLAGVGSIAGSIVVTNGAVGGGSIATLGTLSVSGDATLNGGGAFIRVNKALSPAQSNDMVSVTGTVNNLGNGTVTVTNLGPALNTGDRFVLFPGKIVTGGNNLNVTGAGMIWTNKLAIDGSIQVLGVVPSINTNPTNITYSVDSGTLNLSWPADHTGWSLQVQTNTLGSGLKTNWVTMGYESTNSAHININPANPAVFYRLFYLAP